MNSKTMTFVAIGGGVAVLAAAVFSLFGGMADAAVDKTASAKASQSVTRSPAPKARAAYAIPQAGQRKRAHAVPAPDPTDPIAAKARDLLGRLQAAVGASTDLPSDLEQDLLTFITTNEESRDALFTLAWDRSTSRMVLGHLRVFLAGLKADTAGRNLLAAFDSFDPHAAERAAVAARAKDPALFVANLRAVSGKERLDLMRTLPQESWSDPTVSAWLLESARRDTDEDVRGNAYILLSFGKNTEALPVIAAAVANEGLSVTERKRAAYALQTMPGTGSAVELLRVFETAPDEVRRNLLPALARTPADRRIDDILIETLSGADTSEKTLKAVASSIDARIVALGTTESRDLASRTAETLKGLTGEKTVVALNSLGGAVCHSEPIREALKELERTAPAGGAIQVAIVNVPALRFALGRN